MSLAGDCETEIRELHAFFEDWYHARLPEEEIAFARVADALGPDFEMVTPDGDRTDYDAVCDALEEGYGGREGSAFTIEVRNIRVRDVTEDRCLCTYEEWQSGTETTGRVSTAFFLRDEDAPVGVRWRHLQETWLEAPETER